MPLLVTPIFSVRSMRRSPGRTAPGQRHGDALAGGDVGRAADDLEDLAGADRHAGQRQAVGARMLLDTQELADDDVAPVGAPASRGP